MCGIAGLFRFSGSSSQGDLSETVRAMTDTLYHRGPDGGDVWVDDEIGLGLGHRRLSIIDLSDAGSQPMASGDGRFIIVYNGEIYNANDLRPDLEALGFKFRGHSDTEVIVNGFAAWGVRETIEKLIGMFAIAAWDKKDRKLYLVRDRVGIKPVFWGHQNGKFFFASELKAFSQMPEWRPEVNREAVAAYLRYTYVPAPFSIFKNVQKLEPGCILSIRANEGPQFQRYWDAAEVAYKGKNSQLVKPDDEIRQDLEDLLFDAVQRRMIADVPLGAFLSGGVDSSTVVALMQKVATTNAKTFSIGFENKEFDEAIYAREVAKYLGTDHTELYVTSQITKDVIPNLAQIYDEPFSDSSQIPTYLVSKMTKEHVTVALSGDGGDELFAGYNRYTWGSKIEAFRKRTPDFVRHGVSELLQKPSPESWDKILSPLSGWLLPNMIGDKIHKAAPIIGMDDPLNMYLSLVTHLEDVMPGIREEQSAGWTRTAATSSLSFVERMQLLDMTTYLPDDILTKVDRASMATSLEVRVPILDHRIIELSWRIPEHLKLKGVGGKNILRQILYKHVPKELIERPKAGFAIPLNEWLRGSLKGWAEDLLNSSILYEEFGIDRKAIMNRWHEHQSGARNWQYQIWAVLMLASWAEKWLKDIPSIKQTNVVEIKNTSRFQHQEPKKRLAYFSASPIPSPMANSVQVMGMSGGFVNAGLDVTLFSRKSKSQVIIDPYVQYGIRENFSIVHNSWPQFRLFGGLVYKQGVRSSLTDFYKHQKKFDFAYGRDIYSMQNCLKFNIPFCYEVHTPPPNQYHETLELQLFKSPFFKGLVCISHPLKEYYLEHFEDLIPDKVQVLPSGARRVDKDIHPVALPGRSHATHVGYVGQFHKGKGHMMVIELSQKIAQMEFHLVGGSPSQVEEMRNTYRHPNIHFHGAVNHSSVSQFIKAFDVCIAPFQKETFGYGGERNIAPWMSPLKIFEYMSHGKIIIASNLPIVDGILFDRKNALLCDPENLKEWEDAIYSIVNDSNLSQRIALQAKSDFESNYDFINRAQKICKFFDISFQ